MDRLKYINDNFGHTEGDNSIRTISVFINSIANTNELCVRTGGDEFLIIGIDNYKKEEIEERLNKLKAYISVTAQRKKEYPLCASIGYALSPAKNSNFEKVVAAADEEMYKEKRLHHEKGN